jgi:hypothetical protein
VIGENVVDKIHETNKEKLGLGLENVASMTAAVDETFGFVVAVVDSQTDWMPWAVDYCQHRNWYYGQIEEPCLVSGLLGWIKVNLTVAAELG